MNPTTQLFLFHRGLTRLYDRYIDVLRQDYILSKIEITIISFLHNNPEFDTGADICEYRMLSKGNVSQGIEALIQKGYLMRAPDTKDRRKIHLHLTPKADEIVLQIDEIKDAFHKKITDGISPSDLALYQQASDKIFNNICKELERKESSHES